MGGSSRNKGNQWAGMAPAKPDATMTKGLGAKGGTNAYYSDKSLVPQAGGLVRPDSIPGLAQGIGLNAYKPPAGGMGRNQLAQTMVPTRRPTGRALSDWERGSPFYGQPVPGAYGNQYPNQRPNGIYRRGSYSGGSSHGGGGY